MKVSGLLNAALACVILIVLGGCAWAGAKYVESETELAQLAQAGVQVEAVEGAPATGRTTSPGQVELYYYMFKPFGAPDAIVNWEYHYKIAPASSPKYRVKPFAKLTVFRQDRNDAAALEALRQEAAKLGADAIVNLIRIPQTSEATGNGMYTRSDIWGYSYAGTAVVRKTP